MIPAIQTQQIQLNTISIWLLILGITLFAFFSDDAQANPNEDLRLSGFATIGAGRVHRDDQRFLDYTDTWSFHSDSIFGGQAQYQITNRLSATGQIVARGFTFDDDDNFNPVVDWLFISFQWSPETRIRLGRMRTPLYLFSDSLEVGYSYPWIRPPVDTYTFLLSPISNFDGIDFSTNLDFGNSDLDIQLLAGVAEGKYIDFDIDISPMLGANFTSHWDSLILRYGITASYTDADSKSFSKLADNYLFFEALDPVFREIHDSHETKGEWFVYHGIGVQWAYDYWTFISETYVVAGPGKDFSNDSKGWYLSLSRQMGNFSPYIVIGYYKNVFSDDIKSLIKISQSRIPEGTPGLAALDELRTIDLAVVENFNEGGKSYTAGLRYDFHTNAAFKIEVEYFDSTALLTRGTQDDSLADSLVTSLAVDMVF